MTEEREIISNHEFTRMNPDSANEIRDTTYKQRDTRYERRIIFVKKFGKGYNEEMVTLRKQQMTGIKTRVLGASNENCQNNVSCGSLKESHSNT